MADNKIFNNIQHLYRFSKELKRFKNNEQSFLDAISKLPDNYLEEVQSKYKSGDKVNRIRYELLERILAHQKATISDLEKIKNKVKKMHEKNILHSWTNYTILFPLYYFHFKEKTIQELTTIHHWMSSMFQSTDFAKDKVINDYMWKQHFGDTECWIAIYPNDKLTHKQAAQLFISIDHDLIKYGLAIGTEMSLPPHMFDLDSISKLNESTIILIENKLKSVYPKFLEYNQLTPEPPRAVKYYWITANPNIWSVDQIKNNGEVFYTQYNKNENKRRIFSHFEEVQEGDKVVFYESTPRKAVIALGEISGALQEKEVQEYNQPVPGISVKHIKDLVTPVPWSSILSITELSESEPIINRSQGTLFELTETEYQMILNYEEEKLLPIPQVDWEIELHLEQLYFDEKETLLRQVTTALTQGKHIIFTGPPGTGKSKLAKSICNQIGIDYVMSTATSDWSSYDTIGGYRPDKKAVLYFEEGLFLRCFKEEVTNAPLNKWLIIDEINRADIDKAFGALFSVLTGDEITLHYLSSTGIPIVLKPQGDQDDIIPREFEYIVPKDWRIIATMNTYDKSSLYEMSYAFMRRFAFIPVPIPKEIDADVILKYLKIWGIDVKDWIEELVFIWNIINMHRKIGPAIIEDIARYVNSSNELTSAVILYVLPQLEGLSQIQVESVYQELAASKHIDTDRLYSSFIDFFDMKEFL